MKLKAFIIVLLLSSNIALSGQTPEITNSIVVGGVTDQSARFWVRLSEPGNVNIELSKTIDFSEILQGEEILTSDTTNNSGIISVSGLESDTKYFYRVVFNETIIQNKLRSITTFPPSGTAQNFSFAFGSCQQASQFDPDDQNSGNIFRELINHDLSFFLQIGDWTYPDTTDNLPDNNDFYTADYKRVQENYSSKYNKLYLMDSLLSTIPVDYVYDDHDFMNNNSSATTSSYFVPTVKPFIIQEIENPEGARENSIKGYVENFPGYSLPNESRGIYHKFSYGNAEFFVLDLRSQRSPNLNPLVVNDSGKYVFATPEGHSILGRDNSPGSGENQLDWFLSSLKNSTAKWKFVISTVPFNAGQAAVIALGILFQDLQFSVPGYSGTVYGIAAAMEVADKWAGFPEDTDSVLNFIKNNKIQNVIILSGDQHTAAMDDGTNAGLPEIMAGALDQVNSRSAAGIMSLGINIWNKGGQLSSSDAFNDAFSKITVYGADSVNLALIDEFGTNFASYTIPDQEKFTGIEELLASNDFELKQNYPNPFNPVTTIYYALPEEGFVTLKVYDILGKEVVVLVNEQKKAGMYAVKFSAGDVTQSVLPSGIYFYSLIVRGNNNIIYRDTKKLVLLK